MSLSDKIDMYGETKLQEDVIRKRHVKKFIKELKEELRGIPVIEDNCDFYQDIATIHNRIDKLAGEDLI